MRRLRAAAGVLLVCLAVYFGPLLLLSSPQHGASWSVNSSGQIERQAIAELLEQRLRHLHQNDFSGSTVPPKFTQLDRAAETQRIYRSVAVERCALFGVLSAKAAVGSIWAAQQDRQLSPECCQNIWHLPALSHHLPTSHATVAVAVAVGVLACRPDCQTGAKAMPF